MKSILYVSFILLFLVACTPKTYTENHEMNVTVNQKKTVLEELEKKTPEETNKKLTTDQAIDLVKQYLDNKPNPNYIYEYDHDNENGHYVIHVYEIVIDDPTTKVGHTATWGWYAVDPINKNVYNILY